jgi:ribonuclease Z
MNERFFLIDCGEGTQIQLRRFKYSPARINHIFISHLHGDHVFGLFGLLSTLGMMGRKVPLHMYGPTALEEMLESHLRFFGALPYTRQYHLIEDGKTIYEDAKNEVVAIRLLHRTETYGYLFKEKPRLLNIDKVKIRQYQLGVEDIKRIKQGNDHITEEGAIIPNSALTLPAIKLRSYAYISDTAYMKNIAEKLRGVDLMFHEATFLERDSNLAKETFHSTAKQAAMVAKEAIAGKLLIGHFSTRYKDVNLFVKEAHTIFGDTFAVNDGDRFVVEQTREGLG